MKLLAVDTSTEACSAALYVDGQVIERFQLTPRTHTKLIMSMIDSVMAEAQITRAQLDGLAFGRGPGSFTGIRIATGVIHGLALGLDLPVVPVSTLAALAQDYFSKQPEDVAFVGMDARMDEVFWGVYQRVTDGSVELLGKEMVSSADSVIYPELKGAGVGSGWKVYPQMLTERLNGWVTRIETDYLPTSAAIARLGVNDFNKGLAVDVELAQPVYLRDKVAKKESER